MESENQFAEWYRGFVARRAAQQARYFARQPRPAQRSVGDLLLRSGWGAPAAQAHLGEAWAQAVGPVLGPRSVAMKVNRGAVEVLVSSSVLIQELRHQEKRLIQRLSELLPEVRITRLHLRVGRIEPPAG